MKQFDKIHQQYNKVRPAYPAAVYDEIVADLPGVPIDLAVDIACGSGQSIDGLKRIARKIIGVDIGSNLLADARKRHPDVTFVHGSGELSLKNIIWLRHSCFMDPTKRSAKALRFGERLGN